MQRLLIVSNRLPVSVEKRKGEIVFRGSVGGVATGLGSYHNTHESLWVGWADVPTASLDAEERQHVRDVLAKEHSCVPVFLTANDARDFYRGFSNKTLWPLFHYFTRYAKFDASTWAAYERVNRKYRDAVLEIARPGDIIWVNDYQLMLLPAMLREKLPEASIGFFLHIPWPSFEVFRVMPWRREIVAGLLGADLVGFHTYDYARYFLDAAQRLLGVEEHGRMIVEDRMVTVDAFPMGIDFERYATGAHSPGAAAQQRRIREATTGRIVLSIDRLDYTKGIPERLRAFETFLERHPEWHQKVKLVCVAVPSRERVDLYRRLKEEVDGLVGSINGRYATMDWTPVRYLYRSVPFDTLCAMYAAADVALVTPLRDGMNLIAKEYVAAHSEGTGVLVLSEMAGAARELVEAVLVNPYDHEALVAALETALEIPVDEQRERNIAMAKRLSRYTVQKWAEDFLGSLEEVKMMQLATEEHRLDEWQTNRLLSAFQDASRRLLMLDYDGTLVHFASRPELAGPGRELRELLRTLTASTRTEVVIISGRERATLEEWLGDLPVDLVAEHGVWLRGRSREWVTIEPMSDEWKPRVRPTLELYVDRTPGSFVEEKDYSLVWHYRQVEKRLGVSRATELKDALSGIVADLGLSLMEGNRVLEVKATNVTKGRAAHRWMSREDIDFVLVVGDDRTDEDTFEAAPDDAWTLKVGAGTTRARYSLRDVSEVRALLERLVEVDEA